MKTSQIMEANTETPCAACGRKHRKLFLTDHGWLGSTCKEDVALFLRFPEKRSIAWHGHERIYDKVARLMAARK